MGKILNTKNRILLTLFDPMIGLLLKPFSKPAKRVNNPRRILMIRLAHIGDAVLTFPAAGVLKKAWPDATLYFLTSRAAAGLLRGNPHVDVILPYDAFWFYKKPLLSSLKDFFRILKQIRSLDIDLAIDFRADIRNILLIGFLGRARSIVSYGFGGGRYLLSRSLEEREQIHKMDFHLDLAKAVGGDPAQATFELYLDESDAADADAFMALKRLSDETPVVGIHAGARMPLKQWPLARFAQVANHLIQDRNIQVILTGSPEEAPMVAELNTLTNNRAVDCSGQLNLRQLAAVMKKMDLFICNDTSTLHMAAAVGTPTLSLFGPSLVLQFAPRGSGHIALSAPVDCRPCDQRHCVKDPFADWCMTRISVNEVIQAIHHLLD